MLIVKHKVNTELPIIDVEAEMLVFEQGENDFIMYFLLEGEVKLFVNRNNTEQDIATVKKYEFFGNNEMYTHALRSVSAKTITPCKFVVIKTEAEFEQFVTENRWLSGKIMETMSEQLVRTNEALTTKRLADTKTNVVLEAQPLPNPNGTGGGRRIIRRS